MTDASTRLPQSYEKFLGLSAKVGSNPDLVQAAGGNTSIKTDDDVNPILWIKASGTWLQDAERKNIMVPLHFKPLLHAIEHELPEAEQAKNFVASPQTSLKPSIETVVHTLMPQKVVLHVHCIQTIAWSVLKNCKELLTPILNDFKWAYVPYVRPGMNLARAIQKHKNSDTNVLILGNHGLVVAAESVDEAENLLNQVVSKLKKPHRNLSATYNLEKLNAIIQKTDYRLPTDEVAHHTALSQESLDIATQGSLYPDHLVFLGRNLKIAHSQKELQELASHHDQAPPKLVVIPQVGVVLHQSVIQGADQMARCLADVVSRLQAHEQIRYLSEEEEHQILNWDEEKYRQSLAAKV